MVFPCDMVVCSGSVVVNEVSVCVCVCHSLRMVFPCDMVVCSGCVVVNDLSLARVRARFLL